MATYKLTIGAKGYVSKPDPTNTTEGYLVAGSQNVIINDQEKIESRAGYELFGVANSDLYPVKSDFSWLHSDSGELLLREINGTLQWYSEESDAFETLLTGLSATKPVRFAVAWNGTELEDILLFVNGTATLYEWSGGEGTYASSTATTIVINETIASERFLTTGTRKIRVKDSGGTWREFTVSSQAASTFTVAEDPTAYTFTAGAIVVQSVRSNSVTFQSADSQMVFDTIKVLKNQVWFGSHTSRRVYLSKDTDYTSCQFSSPRVAGEGALVTLDDVTTGLEYPDDEKMIVFSGKDRVYQVTLEISPGSTSDREVPRTKPLLISPGQGAISQELICKIKQALVWVSNNKELVELGQVENLPGPQALPISDPIKPDFTATTFTNGEALLWRSSVFITAPADGKVFIFDLAKRFWQPPQVLGMRRLTVYNDLLYGHSNAVGETYQLFTGLSDNGNTISFKAHFAYINGGDRAVLKRFDKYFTELYLAGNSTINVQVLFEWKGSRRIQTYELIGSEMDFLFTPSLDASLGVNPLGTNPLGGLLEAGEDTPKYRRFKPLVPTDHFEYQTRFEAEGSDVAFQILCHGPNLIESKNLPAKITQ